MIIGIRLRLDSHGLARVPAVASGIWMNRKLLCSLLACVNLLLALSVKINAFDAAGHLIEADVIESLETRAAYRAHPMIRHQEVFFPAHKQMLLLHPVPSHELRSRRVFREGFVCLEACPMLPINLLVGAPLRMLCYEGVFISDDFALEVCGQARMVFCQPCGRVSNLPGMPSRHCESHL